MGKELERFKKKWLEWALNLPIINLNKLSPREYHSLNSEALFFCSSEFRFMNEESFFKRLTPERYSKVERKVNLSELKKALLPATKFIWEFSTRPGKEGKLRPIYSTYKSLSMANISIQVIANLETSSFEVDYVTGDYLSLARLNLVRMIESFPIESLIKCKGCSKYFIDLTLRKKNFCNSLCAARYISKVKREDMRLNHPRKYRAYLKEQRERMRLRRVGKWDRDSIKRIERREE